MKKRLLSSFMAMVMVIGMLPTMTLTALAADLPTTGGTLSAGDYVWNEAENGINSDGTFTVESGTVTVDFTTRMVRTGGLDGVTSYREVPAFIVKSGATLVIKSSTKKGGIYGGTGGGIIVETGGTLKMYDGVTLEGCSMEISTADSYGGGAVQVNKEAFFYMYGGTIRDCDTMPTNKEASIKNQNAGGGGVYNAGTFCMYGGIIDDCSTGYSNTYGCLGGGGVFNNSTGTFKMERNADSTTEPQIKECWSHRAASNAETNNNVFGAGVYNEGTFNLAYGSILSNGYGNVEKKDEYTVHKGGGVYNAGTLNISGGTIKYNYALQGSGVYNRGTLNISGNPYINENDEDSKSESNGKGIYLIQSSGPMSIVGPMTEGANVYITRNNATTSLGAFATSNAKYTNLSKFFTTYGSMYVTSALTDATYTYSATEDIGGYTCNCGCGADGSKDNTVWTPLMEGQTITVGGNYYLCQNLTGDIIIPDGVEVTLCRDHSQISGNITTQGSGKLDLYKGNGMGKVTGSISLEDGNNFTMTGGTITGEISATKNNIKLFGGVVAPVTLKEGQTITNMGFNRFANLTVTTTGTNVAIATGCTEDDVAHFTVGNSDLTTSKITYNGDNIYISDTATPSITPTTSDANNTTALSLVEDVITSQYFKAEVSLGNNQDYFTTTYNWHKSGSEISLGTTNTYNIPTDAAPDDSGTYICEVTVTNDETGSVETETQSFTLTVVDITFSGSTGIETVQDATYGDTLATIFANYSTDDVTATAGGAEVEGTYTLTVNNAVYHEDTILNAGEDYAYAVTFTSNDEKYTNSPVVSGTFNVEQREVMYTLSELTYTGQPQVPTVNITNKVNESDDVSITIADAYKETNAGVAHDAVLTLNDSTGNYQLTNTSTTFAIVQSDTEFKDDVTTDKATPTYGDTIHIYVTPTATGVAPVAVANGPARVPAAPSENQIALFIGGTQITEAQTVTSGTKVTFTIDTTKKALAIGANTITAKYIEGPNMAAKEGTVTITLSKKAITTATIPTGVTKEYDGTASFTDIALVLGGDVKDGDTVTATATLTRTTANVADDDTFTVTSVSALSGTQAGYYTLATADVDDDTNATDITAKALTITTLDQEVTYGTAISSETTDVTITGLITGETLDSIVLTESNKNVSTDDETVDVTSFVIKKGETEIANSNYDVTYTKGDLTITPLEAVLAWAGENNSPSDFSFIYDGSDKTVTATVTNAAYTDALTFPYTETVVGNYTATITDLGNTNYKLPTDSSVSRTWDITKAPVTITVTNNTALTGIGDTATVTTDPAVQVSIAYYDRTGALVDDIATAPAGTYSMVATMDSGDSANYYFSGSVGNTIKLGNFVIAATEPTVYTVTFDEAVDSALNSAIAGTIHILPTSTDNASHEGDTFIGWSYSNVVYPAGSAFTQPSKNVEMTAVWETPSTITGTVTDSNGTAMAGATITISQNGANVASATTDSNGRYTLLATSGNYLLTAQANGITATTNVIVDGASVTADVIVQTYSLTITIEAGVPVSAVDAVQVAEALNAAASETLNGVKVTVSSTVASDDMALIAEKSDKIGFYVDIALSQIVGDATSPVTDTAPDLVKVTLNVPADFQNKSSFEIYRVHDDAVNTITTRPNADGEKLVISADKTTVDLYVCKFSTYALAYIEYNSGSVILSFLSNVASTENGEVTLSGNRNMLNSTVTITATPDDGYEVDNVTVTCASGHELPVTKNADGTYSYKQPNETVTVTVTFKSVKEINFTDVVEGDYYFDAVKWAVANGITSGTSDTTFSPKATCTRAQAVTFLYRAAGSPEVTGDCAFTDVNTEDYYYDAVLWAVQNNITAGTSGTTFSPNAICTRGQIVTFLYHAADEPESKGECMFIDVNADAYYYDAVLWAVDAGITAGTSDTTFSPKTNCTRGQIMTFLYRNMAD